MCRAVFCNVLGAYFTRFLVLTLLSRLVALKMLTPDKALASKHYDDLKTKPFFNGLVSYMSSGTPVVAMVWEGKNVIKTGRKILGATNPADSEPGTIRFDFATTIGRNLIHGSDSHDSANGAYFYGQGGKYAIGYQFQFAFSLVSG